MGQVGVEPTEHRPLKTAALPICVLTQSLSWTYNTENSAQGGSRTHTHPILSRVALPICVPGQERKAGESNPNPCRPQRLATEPATARGSPSVVRRAGIEPAMPEGAGFTARMRPSLSFPKHLYKLPFQLSENEKPPPARDRRGFLDASGKTDLQENASGPGEAGQPQAGEQIRTGEDVEHETKLNIRFGAVNHKSNIIFHNIS